MKPRGLATLNIGTGTGRVKKIQRFRTPIRGQNGWVAVFVGLPRQCVLTALNDRKHCTNGRVPPPKKPKPIPTGRGLWAIHSIIRMVPYNSTIASP